MPNCTISQSQASQNSPQRTTQNLKSMLRYLSVICHYMKIIIGLSVLPINLILVHLYFYVHGSTVSSILGAWLDQYSEDFWSPPDHGCLQSLISYLQLNFSGSDLERRAHNLLEHFQHRQQSEVELEGTIPLKM